MRLLSFSRFPLAPNLPRSAAGWVLRGVVAAFLLVWASIAHAQPALDAFHWIDFHDAKDAPTVTWVTNALKAEKWASIREIGVQWDAALVLTSERKSPQASPATDAYTVWSVSLSKHEVQPLFHGVSPHILNWTTFGGIYQQSPELAIVYSDCFGCEAPSTFFTTLYYNFQAHAWRARWMRGDKGAVLESAGAIDGVIQTQVYGLLTEPPGRNVLATWTHFDYGKAKPAEDFVYTYSVDTSNGLDQTQALSGDHAEAMEQKICHANPGLADPAMAELASGQNSALCQPLQPSAEKSRSGRKPNLLPPANNHGQSSPHGVKKQ